MIKKHIYIGIGVAVLLFVAALSWFLLQDNNDSRVGIPERVGVKGEALEVTLEFYNEWLEALQSTSTDPYQSDLIRSPLLSGEVRAYLEQKNADLEEGDLEPVLCQSEIPKEIDGKVVYTIKGGAQISILAGGEAKSPQQALITLKETNGSWLIINIDCSQGESGPEREFDFERSGELLKKAAQAPLVTEEWHLTYEENGVKGQTVPLFFDATSICINADATEATCDPSQLRETAKVKVQASMTESGATVKRLTFE